ncbi:hypothetical protein LWE61_10425 [Sphingobium sufflavum]|uniref:hypothetical protein n=1 Tax=Sphingobium sufflavum TaxID=1129547 RepID=UPI001F1FD418|nr:hypothetical protein [Sphingobium sufflavum]MCE7796973.1 hypothetical protein [Sphingobium sufflavum]
MTQPPPLTLFSAAAILALTGCVHGPGTPLREGPARLGETVSVGGPSVRPVRLVEDSRCPDNARCIWAGRVVVRALVSGGRWSRTMDLTLGQPAPVADGALTLVAVTPGKSTTRPVRPRDYRFTFDFQGGL